ncbi:putative flippase GtrA [Duganella sp. SG902]|uniref:GtrA family protein n=1 Tax=Duganella sp. SG902 TaxID=2587016 RepID=UPI00159D8C76|nr:GtrA family protein [Duganella sp. SG902]NVM75099.1 putative flippase GtrA [Duganella sp. SG902]
MAPKTRRAVALFALAGIGGLGVDTLVCYAGLALGLPFYLARLVSFLCAVYFTWQVNRRWTFAAETVAPATWMEWWRYLGAMLGGGAVNYLVSAVAVHLLPAWPLTPLLAVAAGSLAGMSLNFISAKLLVFKRS